MYNAKKTLNFPPEMLELHFSNYIKTYLFLERNTTVEKTRVWHKSEAYGRGRRFHAEVRPPVGEWWMQRFLGTCSSGLLEVQQRGRNGFR